MSWNTVYAQYSITRDDLLKAVCTADILWVGLSHQIDREVLRAAPRLKVIVSPTTGLDHIDTLACSDRDIDILYLDDKVFLRQVWATAEHTVGLILALMRKIPAAAEHTRRGGWDRTKFCGNELHNARVGIVGYGRVGQQVCKLLKPFGCTIMVKDRGYGYIFDSMLELSDVIVNCTADQKWGTSEFSRMKWNSYFVNTARGYNIDEKSLLEFLKSGQLKGAALDVVSDEDDRRTRITQYRNELQEYADCHPDKLIVTPHIAGYTQESVKLTESYMRDKLKVYLESRVPA